MMKRYLLRLGIPTVLAVMLAGILLMLNNFEMRTKVSATLVVNRQRADQGLCGPGRSLQAGDTLTLVQTPAGDITLRIDTVWTEPAARVARVSPLTAIRHGWRPVWAGRPWCRLITIQATSDCATWCSGACSSPRGREKR